MRMPRAAYDGWSIPRIQRLSSGLSALAIVALLGVVLFGDKLPSTASGFIFIGGFASLIVGSLVSFACQVAPDVIWLLTLLARGPRRNTIRNVVLLYFLILGGVEWYCFIRQAPGMMEFIGFFAIIGLLSTLSVMHQRADRTP